MKYISLDTETTGLDFAHGARPFFVTTCDPSGELTYWEWEVDPQTRTPRIPTEDVESIQALLDDPGLGIVFQNAKFDLRALSTIGVQIRESLWPRVHDILYSAHLLFSNKPKDLTTQAALYLAVDIQPYEDALERAVKDGRRRAHQLGWRIAKAGLPEMPSAKDKTWKYDCWLPGQFGDSSVLVEYANADSAVTIKLFERHQELLAERNLLRIYQERIKLLRIVYLMEGYGVTLNADQLKELEERYIEESDSFGRRCKSIASGYGYDLTLPKSGNNKSLSTFCFDPGLLNLPVVAFTASGNPSLDAKIAIPQYLDTLPERSKQLAFIDALRRKRKRDTMISYAESYRKFWLPIEGPWRQLYPSVNPVGTDTLRWSSQYPNEQQISKQKDELGFNLRYAFGPLPGREWWSLDYDNLELRIPAYECGEPAMLELFERPDDPPYYGSYHLLIFSILHPDKYDHDDPEGLIKARDKYKSTWYQWTKNGNFAELYGAVEASGTADRAFHMAGAQRLVASRLKEKAALNQKYIQLAEWNGYVETLPDKTVDPERGYPLRCTRSEYGKIIPTVPLNYHVQGTACWVMMRAMLKVQEYFDSMKDFDARIVMNVHDEIVIDLPYAANRGNLPKVRKVQHLMASCGDDVGVKLTAGMNYHPNNWSEAV